MDRNTLRQLDYWEEARVGPGGAIQHGQVWLTESCTINVEIKLPSHQQLMPIGWKDQVRNLIEGRFENRRPPKDVLRLRFTEIAK